MKTILPKISEIKRAWHLIDAENQVLGKIATKAATVLRGKHKPTFTPHLDTGDGVIIINAEKIIMTGHKLDQKKYYRYSGHPGNVREKTARKMLAENPAFILETAIAGMIPLNRHKKEILKRLKVYAGAEHPHMAQSPVPLAIS